MNQKQSISIASAIEAHNLASDTPFILLLDVDIVDQDSGVVVMTYHYANNPDPLTFNGVEYTAGYFDAKFTVEGGRAGEATLTVHDMTQALQQQMEANGGAIGSRVAMWLVNGVTMQEETVEFFEIVSASSAGYAHSFTLGAENMLSQVFPRRSQTRDFCQWRYKDPATCGYSGALASCDLTLQGPNGCAAHGNTINFGGFPGINTNGVSYG